MPSAHPHLIRCTGASLVMSCLAACGGLPATGEHTPSKAIKGDNRTPLAAAVLPRVAEHPGQSGIHALAEGQAALAARLALLDAAHSSIDVQYFIWHSDLTSKVVLEHVFRAADRGVRVRMLLDDVGTMPSDASLLAIDSHPNIEVRMFNPVSLRSPRWLGLITEFRRINRRMHNKSLTVDGQVAIVGGRNIGDHYFDASGEMNFVDLDVAVIGPVVQEVSDEFDLYWNHRTAIPITALSRHKAKPGQIDAMRKTLLAQDVNAEHSPYADDVRGSEFARQLRNGNIPWSWGRATTVSDHPDKVVTTPDKAETHLSPKLREVVDSTNRELFLVSPYFVPGKEGIDILAGVRQRGARVVVITNSLAATDGLPVHSKYQHYRKPLLNAGIELYEMKPTAAAAHGESAGSLRGPLGKSTAGLHAKTFSFDRRIAFVGSYNLDPRSNRLNTEMGVFYDCPELAGRMPETVERHLAQNAYRIVLQGTRIEWVTRQDGQEVRYKSEPGTTLFKRIKVRILSWLPIEGLL